MNEETFETGDRDEAQALRRRVAELERKVDELEADRAASGERRKAEAALRESEALLRQVIDLVPHFIFAKDREGRFLLANQAVADAYGTTTEELVGKRDLDFARAAEEAQGFRSDDLEVMDSGHPKLIPEERITDAEGRVRVLQTTKIPLTFPHSDRPAVLGVAIDITELKQAEEERLELEAQIQYAQKLKSLGVLAGGIAHDFNNLLGGILGNAGLSLLNLAPDSICRPFVEEIERAAQRAAELASQMLAYSGKGRLVIDLVDLNRQVQDLLPLIEASISKKAKLELRLGDPSPVLEGDPNQIRQVVMNLVTNASDALGAGGGTVIAVTGVLDADPDDLRTTYIDDHLPAGRYAYLEISDDGCGMDEEAKAKVFDPFFTTKATGRGLGLAAVLGIVRSHRGAVQVESALGEGSVVRVLFPAGAEEDLLAPAAEEAAEPAATIHRTILVVDDEEMIRFVASKSLELAGFEVLEAADGHRALEIFARRGDEIDAVLLDMSMPILDGVETFRELRRLRPNVRVVFSSGYSEQEASHRLGGADRVSFIQKPYLPQDLARQVRQILET